MQQMPCQLENLILHLPLSAELTKVFTPMPFESSVEFESPLSKFLDIYSMRVTQASSFTIYHI